MARKSRPGRRRKLYWLFTWYFAPETRAPPRGEGPESAALRLSLPPARRQAKRLGLEQSAADLLDGTSIDRLECERDALAAADAHGDDPAPEAVPTPRKDEAGVGPPTPVPRPYPLGAPHPLSSHAVRP